MMSIIITMCKLLFAMAAGFYLEKRKIFTEEVSRAVSSMILCVTSPSLMMVSVTYVESGSEQTVLRVIIGGVLLYVLLPFLGLLVAKIIRAPKGQVGVYTCMIIFANTGFIGYPVVQTLYGDAAIFYDTMFHLMFYILFYTLGLYLIAKDAGAVSKFELKSVLSIGFVSSIASVLLYFSQLTLPQFCVEPLSFVGNLTSPLSLVVLGSNIARYSLKDIFGVRRIYALSFFRLIVIPLLIAALLNPFFTDKTVVAICALTVGMPVGATVAMAGCQYDSTTDISNIGVAFTTLCMLITLPIVATILGITLGV